MPPANQGADRGMKLSMIAAWDRKGLIGRDGELPWRLPADLQHFKSVTMGKPVIMGRKTAETLPKPLPGRRNIVLTRDPAYHREGFDVFHDVDSVLTSLQHVEETMVIGGAEIYRLFLPFVSHAYITEVDGEFEGDTWFPIWPLTTEWRSIKRERFHADEKNPHAMTFIELEKVENN
ncbi:MAG TPA: dihydrofolate reductase [Kiritimatiellia bacterium]|nr:dihydrofolate reductase [Kiritimatiellia bacterium]